MEKIGLIFCLLVVLFSNVIAATSKDIMIKYEYTDKTSEFKKEVIDNKVEYVLNEDKILLKFDGNNKNPSVLFFEVSKESLEWLKEKVDINENSNIYYLKFLDEDSIESNLSITVEEISSENKVVNIYDKNGNKLEKATNNCYVVVEFVSENKVEFENEETDKECVIPTIPKQEKSISPLLIFVIPLTVIFIVLIIIIKTRKDKENE